MSGGSEAKAAGRDRALLESHPYGSEVDGSAYGLILPEIGLNCLRVLSATIFVWDRPSEPLGGRLPVGPILRRKFFRVRIRSFPIDPLSGGLSWLWRELALGGCVRKRDQERAT